MFYFRSCCLHRWQQELPSTLSLYAMPRIYPINRQVQCLPLFQLNNINSHVEEMLRESSLSTALVTAIHSRKTTTDITHIMSFASTSVDQVVDTLYAALLTFLEGPLYKRMAGLWTWEVLGIAIEVYGYDFRVFLLRVYGSLNFRNRVKVRQARKEDDRESLLARRQIAHDLCSIVACSSAFEDCKDGDGYDLGVYL